LVEHQTVGQVVSERDEPWEEGDVLVIPMYEEQLVVTKRLVLRERIRVRRVGTTERQLTTRPGATRQRRLRAPVGASGAEGPRVMSLETSTFDRPFPGARSQVPGFRREESQDIARQPRWALSLPLAASPLRRERGWTIRLQVRAEQIKVEKQVVVRERVRVRRRTAGGSTQFTTDVRKEVLKVRVDSRFEITPPLRTDADDHGS